MCGKNQLKRNLTRLLDLLRVCDDLHSLGHRIHARRNKRTRALDLDNADAARADRVDLLEVAQRRDLDAGVPRGLQDGAVLRHREGHTVDFYVYHFFFHVGTLLSYFLTIAPNLHFSMQAPHLMHLV